MDKNTIVPISLSLEAVNYIIMVALGARPHSEVDALVADIRMQVNAHMQSLRVKAESEAQ